MKNLMLIVLCSTLAISGLAGRRHEAPPVDPRLKDVRTIFVKGNNEAATIARDKLQEWTCFTLAAKEKKADAILELSDQSSVNGSMISGNRERSTVSGTLTDQDGDILWSKSSSHDAGIVNTGAGSGAHMVLLYLNQATFPDVHQGFRGLKRDTCPAEDEKK
jgi:hypothetical protein